MLLVPDGLASDILESSVQVKAGACCGQQVAMPDHMVFVDWRDAVLFTEPADQVGGGLDLGVGGRNVLKVAAKVYTDGEWVIRFRVCSLCPFRAACFNGSVLSDDIMIAAPGPAVPQMDGVDLFSGKVIVHQVAGVVDNNQVRVWSAQKVSEL